MAAPVQLIFNENPDEFPAPYQLPPGLQMQLSSVVGRFDGSGAAGDFKPALALYAQNGNLIARVAISQTFSPGDSGVVTWAPFLRKQAASTPPPPSTGYQWARRQQLSAAADQVISTGTETNVALNTFNTSDAGTFAAHDLGTEDGISVLVDGLYSYHGRLFWDDWPNDHEVTLNGVDPDAWAGYSHHASAPTNTLVAAFGGMVRLAAGQDLYLSVYHEFGSNRSLERLGGNYFELCFLGDIDLGTRDGGP